MQMLMPLLILMFMRMLPLMPKLLVMLAQIAVHMVLVLFMVVCLCFYRCRCPPLCLRLWCACSAYGEYDACGAYGACAYADPVHMVPMLPVGNGIRIINRLGIRIKMYINKTSNIPSAWIIIGKRMDIIIRIGVGVGMEDHSHHMHHKHRICSVALVQA